MNKLFSHPLYRFAISITAPVIGSFLISSCDMDILTRLMIYWIISGTVFLILCFISFSQNDSHSIKKISMELDKGHQIVFLILLVVSLLSLAGIILLLKSRENWKLPVDIITIIYLTGILISWLVLHTIFGIHYAHLYYKATGEVKALTFPETAEPNYVDFAYFSFIIGMTFQVSDVVINLRSFRKVVLVHSLFSFIYNVFILALSISAISNT